MRIIQLITRPQRRGAEIFAVQLAEQLLRQGHEVWVIAILKGGGSLSFSGTFIPLDLSGNTRLDIFGFRDLAKKIKEMQPDIVQANAADTLRYAIGAEFFLRKRYRLIYRNANQISGFIRNPGQLMWNRYLHSRLDAVISVSEHSKMDYQILFRPKCITCIPIGIDPQEIELKLAESPGCLDSRYLLFVGSLVSEKDPLGMLEIVRALLNSQPYLQLKFLGSGPLEGELKQQILIYGLEDAVELIPNQTNIFSILTQAKALVMSSKNEGLPGVVLEAMYCEIPVIAYDIGGIPEVIQNGKTGWLVPAGDRLKFQQAIIECLVLPEYKLQKITITAKKLVEENYGITKIASSFEDFYEQLLSY